MNKKYLGIFFQDVVEVKYAPAIFCGGSFRPVFFFKKHLIFSLLFPKVAFIILFIAVNHV